MEEVNFAYKNSDIKLKWQNYFSVLYKTILKLIEDL